MTATKKLRLDRIIRCSQQNGRSGDSYRSPGQQMSATDRWVETWRGKDGRRAEIVMTHDATRGRHSGKTVEREEVEAVVKRIEAGLTDGAIIMSLDRFSRAPLYETLSVYKQIEDAKGYVVAANMPFNDGTPEARLMVTVMLGLHRYQWEKTRDRYADNRRDAIAHGKAMAARRSATDTRTRRRSMTAGPGRRELAPVVVEPQRPIVGRAVRAQGGGRVRGWSWRAGLTRSRRSPTAAVGAQHGRRHDQEPDLPREVAPRRARQRGRARGDRHARRSGAARRSTGRRTPRGNYVLSGLVRCAGCSQRMQASTGGRNRKPPTFKRETRDCPLHYQVVTVEGIDAEVTEQLFNRLQTFHVRAVDDQEVAAAEAEVEERGAAARGRFFQRRCVSLRRRH